MGQKTQRKESRMSAVLETPQLPAVRAATALQVETLTTEFKALAEQSKSIVAITNPDGYAECHAARMRLVKARTSTTKRGKDAREDAQAFAKAVIEQEKALLAIIEPEEKRLQKIQDDHDAIEAEKKRVAAEAEAKRIESIQAKIASMISRPSEMAASQSFVIAEQIKFIEAVNPEGWAEEFLPVALEAQKKCIAALAAMFAGAKAREDVAAAEKAKLEAERAELEKLRAEQRERDRLALEARQREEAEARAKIEAEQAESRKRMAEEERLATERRAEEDRLRAEQRAKEDAEAKTRQEAIDAENARLRAEKQAQDNEKAEIERQRMELLDGNEILKLFVTRFGKRPEFRKVVTAIHAHLTGK
jgi:hypothetical protein